MLRHVLRLSPVPPNNETSNLTYYNYNKALRNRASKIRVYTIPKVPTKKKATRNLALQNGFVLVFIIFQIVK
jgi:hypothetical protein